MPDYDMINGTTKAEGSGSSSKLKIILIIGLLLAVAILIAVLGLTAATYVKVNSNKEETSIPPTNVTTTATPYNNDWIDAASFIKGQIDDSKDPCTDFWHYACGGWIAKNPPPQNESYYDNSVPSAMGAVVVTATMKGISKINNSSAPAFRKLKTVYESCKTEGYGQKDFTTDIGALLKQYGGWPLITDNWTMLVDLGTLLGNLTRNYGISVLVSPTVDTDPEIINVNTVIIQEGQLLLQDQDAYNSTNATEEYVNEIVAAAMKLNPKANETQVTDAARRVLDLEMEIARGAYVPAEDQRNSSLLYNPYKATDLDTEFPLDNAWVPYLKALLPIDTHQILLNDRMVIIQEPSYYKALGPILGQSQYNEADVVNYIMTSLIFSLKGLGFMGDKTIKNSHKEAAISIRYATNSRNGEPSNRATPITATPGKIESSCVNDILINFVGQTTGRIYIDEVGFGQEARNEIFDMINNVISALNDTISGLKWFDSQTKAKAAEKINQIVKNPGYPIWIKDDIALDVYYRHFNPSSTWNWFKIYGDLINWFNTFQYENLKNPPNRRLFQMSPALVNAEYMPEYNSITFPAAILQAPVFRGNGPKVCNYGSIGMVLGHELTHGFDDEGVQYDGEGKVDYWIDSWSKQGFDKMAQCIVDEYHNFTFQYKNNTIHLNGVTNQGENIADNGGIRQAFKAYTKLVKEKGAERKLPSLENFSWEQIFFISASTFWCGEESRSYMYNHVETNPHSPAKFRVVGPMRNMDEFAKAFNCNTTSGMYGMNPPRKEKCYVWANRQKGC